MNDWYNYFMPIHHPKAVRRYVLQMLYDAYLADPLEMLSPETILAPGEIERHALALSMHYLRDDGLAEVMLGYRPPLFVSARITVKGIDLVENRYEFDRRFPRELPAVEASLAEVPELMERLVAEADLCSLDRPRRLALLRDVQYLRAELCQPFPNWRFDVIQHTLDAIAASESDELHALAPLRRLLNAVVG
jgi:hypothetical protein